MNQLFNSNIKKSVEFLSENPGLMELFYDLHFAYFMVAGKQAKLAQITPSFKKKPSGLLILSDEEYLDLSPSTPSFTIYAIKTILRSILLSFRFIQSGDLLRDNKSYSLSVFSYYTASFHILQTFLALNGRIIVRPTDNQRQELALGKALIMSRLTKYNGWNFEGFSQSHASMWKEVSDIFGTINKDILERFLFFFRYIVATEHTPPSDNQQLIVEGLKRFSAIRHEAIYEGYGFDDYVFDSVVSDEEDRFSLKGLEDKNIVYKMFAREFLRLVLKDLFKFKKASLDDKWDKVKDLFLTIILIPPFEEGEPDFSEDSELSYLAKQFNDWLK